MTRPRGVRVTLLALAAVATVVLGLDRTGLTPVVPGYDVRFDWMTRQSSNGREIIVTSDAGDINAWLALRVRVSGAYGGSAKAALSNGPALAVLTTQLAPGFWLVEISDGKAIVQRTKFDWPAGIAISISLPGIPPPTVTLEDWTVYVKDK